MFSSSDVARVARVSLRQLQWWDERGLVRPHTKGHRRYYCARDVVEILVVSELRRKSLSLQKTRWALLALRRELDQFFRLGRTADAGLYLITDLKAFYLEQKVDRVIELSTSAGQPVFVVSVSDQIQRLAQEPDDTRQLNLFQS